MLGKLQEEAEKKKNTHLTAIKRMSCFGTFPNTVNNPSLSFSSDVFSSLVPQAACIYLAARLLFDSVSPVS